MYNFHLQQSADVLRDVGDVEFLSDMQYNAFWAVYCMWWRPVSRQLPAARRQTVTLYCQLKNSTPCCNLNPCDSIFQPRYPDRSQSRDISASETHPKNITNPEMEDNCALISCFILFVSPKSINIFTIKTCP